MTTIDTPAQKIAADFRRAMRIGMREHGLRHEDLARILEPAGVDLHPSAISKILHEQRGVQIEEGVLIASLLDIDLSADGFTVHPCKRCKGSPPEGFVCGTCRTGFWGAS